MKRLLMLLVTLAVAAVVYVTASDASQTPDRTHVSGTWPQAPDLYVVQAGGSLTGGLTGFGCSFAPHHDVYTEGDTAHLTATYSGWEGPLPRDGGADQRFSVRTHLTGTLEDAAGNTYNVVGSFLDDTVHHEWDLRFGGTGRVALTGPAGSVVGTAEFRYVTAPAEWALMFSSVSSCRMGA